MALTLWKDKSPAHLLDDLKGQLDRWFGDYFSKNKPAAASTESIFSETGALMRFPAVDIEEQDSTYVVHAEIPGMKKDEIEVEYRDGCLMIRGEKKFEHEDKRKDFHRIERAYGSFQRTFEIPEDIDADAIKAEYKNGVLEIRLPLLSPEKRRVKRIQIT
jgi:HSP20 family protein